MIVAIELVPDEQQLNIFTLLSRFISINPDDVIGLTQKINSCCYCDILHVFLAKAKYWKCPITLSYCNLKS